MKSLFTNLLALLLVLAVTPATSFAQTTEEEQEPMDDQMSTTSAETSDAQTIAEIAMGNDDLSTLVAALQAAGYDQQLSDENASWTVFAPTNDAFDALPAGVVESLLKPENANSLKYILMYHVSPDLLPASEITSMLGDADNGEINPPTLYGKLTAMAEGESVMLKDAMGNTATVTQTDIKASNGIIHLIDAVLLPENVDVSSLATEGAVGMANDAMDESENMVEEAADATADAASTAYNETKDAVKSAAKATGNAAEAAYDETRETAREVAGTTDETMQEGRESVRAVGSEVRSYNDAPETGIGDFTMENDDFSTLSTAVDAADLGDVLNSDTEFTVFAPTNDAFDKLPEGKLDELTRSGNEEQLKGVLTYHVIASKIDAATLTAAIEANNGYYRLQTLSGESLIASMKDGNVVLTDGNGEYATITETDVQTKNGLVHVIDGVLTPRM